ncbi:hypothetical protein HF563_19065 [Acidithiobacillus ferridurans]|nr:hypothetical protein [Acidithiobacillus ferridurans]
MTRSRNAPPEVPADSDSTPIAAGPDTAVAGTARPVPQLQMHLRFQPSAAFLGILGELNEQFPDWSDGSYDWANQTVDFLHGAEAVPSFDTALYQTPLSRRALNDVLQLGLALLSGHYPVVRQYLQDDHFLFVVGYPRSGGSYLTKELLRGIGLEHTRVSEALAHDGFPEIRSHWYGPGHAGKPYFHLQDSVFQVAEFLVIAHLYYRRKASALLSGQWVIPKKMHKLVYWAGSLKMLLGQGAAHYLVTIRHPIPTAISIYEKCGGLPTDGYFPAQPRSAIERWVYDDLIWLGHADQDIAHMDYFQAVTQSWTAFYLQMASSGIFVGPHAEEVSLLPYGQERLEGVIHHYRQQQGSARTVEPFLTHDKAQSVAPEAVAQGDAAVAAVQAAWQALGLSFPDLSLN